MRVGTFLRTRIEHARNSRLTRPQLRSLQRRKFLELISHVHRNSPYYRRIIEERGIDVGDCVPEDFPPLTKSQMMAEFDQIVTSPDLTFARVNDFLSASDRPSERFAGQYVVLRTTGTTDRPAFVAYSAREWAIGAALAMRIWPVSLRRRRLAYYGLTAGHHGGASHFAAGRRGLARLRFATESCDMYEPIERTIARLNAFQPELLSGYPTSLVTLADEQRRGRLRIAPTFVASGGEALTAVMRSQIDAAFGATVLNVYGSSEHLTMGVGRTGDGGIYLFEDELIFEIEEDRVLVTNLFNYTQPLIRYVLEDRLEPIDDPGTGRPFMKIRDIAGRPMPVPFFQDREGQQESLDPTAFVAFGVADVVRVQLEVLDEKSCILRVALAKGLSEAKTNAAVAAAGDRLAAILAESGLENVSRRVEPVEHFGGKYRTIIVAQSRSNRSTARLQTAAKASPSLQ